MLDAAREFEAGDAGLALRVQAMSGVARSPNKVTQRPYFMTVTVLTQLSESVVSFQSRG